MIEVFRVLTRGGWVSRTEGNVERVVIAVDPHKASWTAAAVEASWQPVATVRVPVSLAGYRALRRFAERWPQASWAIEGAGGLGAPLTARDVFLTLRYKIALY